MRALNPRSVSRKASAVVLAPKRGKADSISADLPPRASSVNGKAARVSSHAGEVCCLQKAFDTTAAAAMQAQQQAESIEHVLKAEDFLHRTRKLEATQDLSMEEKLKKLALLKSDLQKQEREAELKRDMIRKNIDGGWLAKQSQKRYAPLHIGESVDDDIFDLHKKAIAEAEEVKTMRGHPTP